MEPSLTQNWLETSFQSYSTLVTVATFNLTRIAPHLQQAPLRSAGPASPVTTTSVGVELLDIWSNTLLILYTLLCALSVTL